MVMAAGCLPSAAEPPAIAAQDTLETGVSLKSDASSPAAATFAPSAPAAQPEVKAETSHQSAIPEPAAAALGLIGLGLIVLRRYRV